MVSIFLTKWCQKNCLSFLEGFLDSYVDYRMWFGQCELYLFFMLDEAHIMLCILCILRLILLLKGKTGHVLFRVCSPYSGTSHSGHGTEALNKHTLGPCTGVWAALPPSAPPGHGFLQREQHGASFSASDGGRRMGTGPCCAPKATASGCFASWP